MSDQGPATPARRKRTGRPTKFTPEVADRIVEAVGHGLSYADVCRAGNVSERTFYRWKQRGQEATRGRFWQFWQRIEAAAARRAIAYLEAIDRSVLEPVTIRKTRVKETPAGQVKEITEEIRPADIKGALWWLERRIKGFERRAAIAGKVEVPGSDGAPPIFNVVFTAGEEPEDESSGPRDS